MPSADDTPLRVIWRRKLIVIATFAAFVGGSVAVSLLLPKVYSTTSVLLVAQTGSNQTFDAVQTAQVTARTYANLLRSPNLAAEVATQLGGGETKDSVAKKVSVSPVDQTQLVTITASASSPAQAKHIADTYANVFINSQHNLAATTQASVTLAEPAPLADKPSRPKPLLYVLLGALLGLAAGLALAFLRERFDTRLRSARQIEEVFGLPILARIPARGRDERSRATFAEAFRVLRTNLQFASTEGEQRSIAVVSASAREGKTTVVAQLALATAATGSGVLVVEADLRRPALQSVLAPGEQTPLRPGLSNYIVEGLALDAVIHPTSVPTLEWVPSGPPVPSLSGLLESERGRRTVDDFATAADQVIYDCASLSQGADAVTVAGRVDGVILVVDLQRATRIALQTAVSQLDSVRAALLGIVINRDPTVQPGPPTPNRSTTPTGAWRARGDRPPAFPPNVPSDMGARRLDRGRAPERTAPLDPQRPAR